MAAIALLTDFGTRDYFVGAMKGVILSVAPSAVIVDITHEIAARDILEAAYTLRACYRDFPAGTIFVAVVDPGVGSERRAIIAESGGYYFVAPDNGVLSFVLGEGSRTHEISEKLYLREAVSSTFHGRDIFASVAAYLCRGVGPSKFGPALLDPVKVASAMPAVVGDSIVGEVIHIDRFGNIVTNITNDSLPAEYTIELGGRVIEKRCRYYAEAGPGEIFSIAGSAGFLEISVRDGSAAEQLKVSRGSPVVLTPRI
jgi:S-adenosylmethionine hydrolase